MTTSKSSRRRARLNAANTTAPATTATAVAASPVPAPRASNEDWRHDYDYVMKDLRKLFIVTGILFAIIIGLGFFI